jgi:8-amino-7-oxononanoate synthase
MENTFEKRTDLMENIGYFRSKVNTDGLISASNSPIQFMRFEEMAELKRIESTSHANAIFTKAIFSPTVPQGQEGLRISLHSFNTKSEIDRLVECISG